ncbi:hypothetical protein [Mycobacteroides chelonae]|uniref:hypothetical protein n=2 Tax=Mycobacteroides chelonae TaxID=1774 RepID=UPI0009942FAB|nr:hypothetical protein [Mycobacteroides chelonae]
MAVAVMSRQQEVDKAMAVNDSTGAIRRSSDDKHPASTRNIVRFLWFAGVIFGVAGASVLILVFWPVPRASVIAEPALSKNEDDVRGAFVEYKLALEQNNEETLLGLMCENPAGGVLLDKTRIQSGSPLPGPLLRTIEAYLNFSDSGENRAQIMVVGLPGPGSSAAFVDPDRVGELWSVTVGLVVEGSRWKVCDLS